MAEEQRHELPAALPGDARVGRKLAAAEGVGHANQQWVAQRKSLRQFRAPVDDHAPGDGHVLRGIAGDDRRAKRQKDSHYRADRDGRRRARGAGGGAAEAHRPLLIQADQSRRHAMSTASVGQSRALPVLINARRRWPGTVRGRPACFQKLWAREALCIFQTGCWLKLCLLSFKSSDCLHQTFDSLLRKVDAGHAVHNCFQCAAASESDDRRAYGLCFDRDDAEVLLVGEDQGAAVGVVVPQFFVADRSGEGDVWPGRFFRADGAAGRRRR